MPPFARAAASPAAAARSASGHDVGTSSPVSSRTNGVSRRSRRGGVAESPPALVTVPLLVDLRLDASQPSQHLAASMVVALLAARCAVLAHARRRDQIERPCPEPVLRAGECAHRADLHGVAGEVGVERLVFEDCDLFECRALEHLDERVASDLLGEAGAPRAQHAAFAVEQHLRRDRDRLGVGALHVAEARLGVAVGHRLVLEWTLTTLVADRAIERVVDQQQFDDAVLRLLGNRRGVLRLHDHALGDRGGARRHGLLLALDLDEALPAGADRVEQRVFAEPWHLNAEELCGPDHQSALRYRDFEPVNDQVHQIGRRWRSRAAGVAA